MIEVPYSAQNLPYAICWMEMGEQPSSLRATSPSMAFLYGKNMLENDKARYTPQGMVQHQDGAEGTGVSLCIIPPSW